MTALADPGHTVLLETGGAEDVSRWTAASTSSWT